MIPGLTKEEVTVKCENFSCGHELWSDNPDEIEQWKYLEKHNALECPICGGKMRFEGKKIRNQYAWKATLRQDEYEWLFSEELNVSTLKPRLP